MKKIPMRSCVITGEKLPKKELIRIVRNKEGEVKVDFTFKMNGRGAYLSKDKDLILLAKKKKLLNRALECEVSDEIYDFLITRL